MARGLSLLRDPLVQFALAGVAIFAVYFALGGTAPGSDPPAPRILIDAARQQLLADQFARTWQRPPTAEEQARLVEDYVEGQVLVREARALGLEAGDSVVEQRLRQKMTFLLAGAGAVAPTEAELQAFYAAQSDRYATSPMIAFLQVPLGETAPAPAELARITAALDAGADPAGFGGPSLLPTAIPLSPTGLIDRQFGQGVAARIESLPEGVWSGPVRSGYGWHLIQRQAFLPTRVPPLEEIADRVRRDWLEDSADARLAARIADLRAAYDVEIAPVAPE